MRKFFFFLINILAILLISNNVTSAQYTKPPYTMGDYILRSCIASVVLIRNHRKSQLPALSPAKNNSIILKSNLINKNEVSADINTDFVQRDPMWRVRNETSSDTPLRTLDIKRGRTRDLIFMKKKQFPEISSSTHYNDGIKEKNAKIIVIKPAKRNGS